MRIGLKWAREQLHASADELPDGAWDTARPVSAGRLRNGFVPGTRFATPDGWRQVETLKDGDQVMTFDDGYQPLVAVEHRVVTLSPSALPMMVPPNALGNTEQLVLMSDNAVMVESDLAETLCSDPFALIPAHTLQGAMGICEMAAPKEIEVFQPCFDDEQLVYVSGSALVRCPRPGEGSYLSGMLGDEDMSRHRYPLQPVSVAELLVKDAAMIKARAPDIPC